MKTLFAATIFSLATLASPQANAGHVVVVSHSTPAPAPAPLTIENQSNAQLKLFVDGRFMGEIRDGFERIFSVAPGYHDIRVSCDGMDMYNKRTYVSQNRGKELTIRPATGTLALTNVGSQAIMVSINDGRDLWLAPGQSQKYEVFAGLAELDATYWDHHGQQRIQTQRFDIDPGRTTHATTGIKQDMRSGEIQLSNSGYETLSIFIDGRDVGSIRSGNTKTFAVDTGNTWVMAVQPDGDTVFSDKLNVRSNETERLSLGQPGRHCNGTPQATSVRVQTPRHTFTVARR